MRERHPQFQLILYDEEKERSLGRGQTMPVRRDGTVDGLPGGVESSSTRCALPRPPAGSTA